MKDHFEIIDVAVPEVGSPSFHRRMLVRFPVTPPTWTTSEGQRVTVHEAEGRIDVRMVDGQLEVMGRGALVVELHSSNCCRIYLRDSMQPASGDTVTPPE